jgi:5'-deoxynucleotidase YfbR-like HD superfamily hydrolase
MTENKKIHPVHENANGLFNALYAGIVSLTNPKEQEIDIKDIANALSKICRFGGHTHQFYSVAQHCVLVSYFGNDYPLEKLMHDASEAYLGDVIKPLKNLLAASYANIETVFETVIAQKFQLNNTDEIRQVVKIADGHLLELEHQAFQLNNSKLLSHYMYANLGIPITHNVAWAPEEAMKQFLLRYAELR